MAPLLVRNLGNYDYGLWEMLGAVIGYMGMLDLGIKSAISRFTATYNAEHDELRLQQIFFTAIVILFAIAILLASVFATWAMYFSDSLGDGSTSPQRYLFVGLILAAQFLFMFPGYVAEGTLEGLQKYHYKNLITLINSVIGSVVLYTFITPQNGLVMLAAVNALGLSVKYVIYFAIIYQVSNRLLSPFVAAFNYKQGKELLVFGSKSLVQGLSHRIETATDSIVIGSILGPAAVPFYSIPANLVGYIRMVVWSATHVLMPVFSDLLAKNDYEKVRELYLEGSRVVVGLVMFLAIGVSFLGSDFISIWIGVEYGNNAMLLIVILVLFSVFPLLNPFSNRLLMASNQHAIVVKWAPISAVLNLGLSIPLCYEFGIIGVAFGSLIPVGLLLVIYLNKCCSILNISVLKYVKESILPSIFPSLFMGINLYFLTNFRPIDGYFLLMSYGLISSVVFVITFILFSLSGNQLRWLKQKISKIMIQSV